MLLGEPLPPFCCCFVCFIPKAGSPLSPLRSKSISAPYFSLRLSSVRRKGMFGDKFSVCEVRGGSRRNSDGDACVIRKGICVHSISINSSQSGETASHRGCDFRPSPFFLPVGRRSSVAEVLHKENENHVRGEACARQSVSTPTPTLRHARAQVPGGGGESLPRCRLRAQKALEPRAPRSACGEPRSSCSQFRGISTRP